MAETQKVEEVSLDQQLRQEYEAKYEIWKAKDLAELKEKQEQEIQNEVRKLFAKWQEEQKPPSLDEIKLLLEQEYAEIPITIPVRTDGAVAKRTFVLRELPQSVERKFYRQFKDRLKTKGPELNAFAQANMDKPFEVQLSAFLETFEAAFDVLADAVVLVLNPFGAEKDVTAQWVADNISLNRQYSIVLAQVEVNKLRDFFSRLSLSGQKAGTMLNPLNFQQLQRLAR